MKKYFVISTLGLLLLMSCSEINNVNVSPSVPKEINNDSNIEDKDFKLETVDYEELYSKLNDADVILKIINSEYTEEEYLKEMKDSNSFALKNYALLFMNANDYDKKIVEFDYDTKLKENYYYAFLKNDDKIELKEFENYDTAYNYLFSSSSDIANEESKEDACDIFYECD